MNDFLRVYKGLNKDNLGLLHSIYTKDVQFIDPAHEIRGLDKLTAYFTALYQNVDSIQFSFHNELEQSGDGYVQWEMKFIHKRLAGAKPITVFGVTFYRRNSDGKVFYHRDYFDLGAMLYEQLPLLGYLITSLKRRVGK